MEELWARRGVVKKKFHKLLNGGSGNAMAQLDEVQEILNQHPEHDGDTHLDIVQQASVGIQVVSKTEHDKGELKSSKVLKRCEEISDDILHNLEQRISADLFRRADGAAIANKVLEIARELDPVRTSTGTSAIEKQIWAMQEKLILPHLQRIDKGMDDLKDPIALVRGARLIVDSVVAAHAEARNAMAAELLLGRCARFRETLVMILPEALSGDVFIATEVRTAAVQLDAIAGKMASLRGSSWDPCITPKVDNLLQAQAIQRFTAHMVSVRASLGKGSKGIDLFALASELKELRAWWQYVGGVKDVCERLTVVHRGADARAITVFWQAASIGDEPSIESMLKAADKFDACRACCEGAGTASISLRGRLAELFIDIRKRLDALSANIAKASELDAATIAMVLQALEGLTTPLWIAAGRAAEAIPQQLGRCLEIVEARARETIAAVGTDTLQVSELLRFADRCDSLCKRLLGCESCPLAPKLRPLAAAACLRAAEAEGCRGAGMDLEATVRALEELWKVLASDRAVVDEVALRTQALLPALRPALVARLAAADASAAAIAWKCARMADGALAAAGRSAPGAGAGGQFCDALTPVLAVHEKLSALSAELAKTNGMNPNVVIKEFESLKPVWPAVAEVREYRNRASQISSLLASRMGKSCDKALSAKDINTFEKLLKYACEVDGACRSLDLKSDIYETLLSKGETSASTSSPAPPCTTSSAEPPRTSVPSAPPTSSFIPPPRDATPPAATTFLGAGWGGDSPRKL